MKNRMVVMMVGMVLGVAIVAYADVFNMGGTRNADGSWNGLASLETVPVGNAGNAGELSGAGAGGYGPDRICGAVGYDYRIGKYEVTAGQYTEFLNAVAKTDTYRLYNTYMSDTSYGSGIVRSGDGTVDNPYTYSVATDFANRSVNCVSYWDACRFANWLHNGQPTGPQGAGTTETGAYTLTTDGMNNNTITRNANATWAVTSEDEWYKAAYYKGGSTNAGYFNYPTSSDTAPGQDMADVSGNNANYYTAPFAYPIDSGKYTTLVGQFQNSASPYGTFDQGGNVWEWNEAILFGSFRGLRGGSFGDSAGLGGYLRASYRDYDYPANEGSEYGPVGFRVSEVPEPTTTIQGTVVPIGYLDNVTDLGVRIAFKQAGTVVQTQKISLDTNGMFTVSNVVPGTYDISIKIGGWLEEVKQNVVISDNPTNIGIFQLKGADANGDNRVDFADFSILQNNYGQSGTSGANPLSMAAAATSGTGCGTLGIVLVTLIGLFSHTIRLDD